MTRGLTQSDFKALKNGYIFHISVNESNEYLLSVKHKEDDVFIVYNRKANEKRKMNGKSLNNLLKKVLEKYGKYRFIIVRRC